MSVWGRFLTARAWRAVWYNLLMVKRKKATADGVVKESARLQVKEEENELARGAETFRQKSRSLQKTQKALKKAPASRKKTEQKLNKRAKKNVLRSQKEAETDLKRAQKRYRKGKMSSDEFAKFQENLQVATERAARTAGEEYVFAEAKLRRWLRRHHVGQDVFDGFALNVLFVLVEVIGGILTGSAAILVNAIRDLGDVFNIVFAYLFQRKSTDRRDRNFTFGYSRHVMMAAFGAAALVLIGATLMIVVATTNLIYGSVATAAGMIVLGVFGLLVNSLAVFRPRKRGTLRRRQGEKVSLWRRSIDLGILDDCFGWLVVLVCGLVMAATGWQVLDAVAAIIIATLVIVNTFSNFRQLLDIFLEKAPESPSVDVVKTVTLGIPHVTKVSKIHVWHLDLKKICVTLHVEIDDARFAAEVKAAVRHGLTEVGADEVTVEIEASKAVSG